MLSEEVIRNRRDVLRDMICSKMQHGVLQVSKKYLRDLELLNWVLGEQEEEDE